MISRLRRPLAVAVVVSLLHAVNDAFNAFLPPLLPRIMAQLELSIAGAAGLVAVLSLGSSLAQPLLGHLADRRGRRLLVVVGPMVSAVFLSLIGRAGSFVALVVLLAIGGLGSAAFHPPGASLAVRAETGRGSGARHAVFSFGGAFGYALGPLLAVALVERLGLGGMWVAMLPILVLAPVAGAFLPVGPAGGEVGDAPSLRAVARLLGGPLGLVFGVSAISAFVQRLFLTFEPIIVAAGGGSERAGAVALSVYLGGQALGTLAGGLLADRFDRRAILATVSLLALPAHALAFGLPPGGAGALVAAGMAGMLNMAVLPSIVVIAQEILPRSAALGSGIVMGLAWAAGSVGVLGAGFLADATGPRVAGLALLPVLLAAAWLARRPALAAHDRPVVIEA